jgi:hypothetical protein
MSTSGALVLLAVGCWCLALLRLTASLSVTGGVVRELQLAGYDTHRALTRWFWVRALLSMTVALAGALTALLVSPLWTLIPSLLLGAVTGWLLPCWLLAWQRHRRQSALRRTLPAFVDRLTLALACGLTLPAALRLAATWTATRQAGALMLQLLPDVLSGGSRASLKGAAAYGAPAALLEVARLIRAAAAESEPWGAERRVLAQLASWSRLRGRRAYDLPEIWQGGSIDDQERTSTNSRR